MFFKKNNNISDSEDLVKVCALLVHAAKIDENYSTEEKNIIKKTINEFDNKNENIDDILKKKLNKQKQILSKYWILQKVKNMSHENKIKIVETLWKIIYSNQEADIMKQD